jgi:hypothetical protein
MDPGTAIPVQQTGLHHRTTDGWADGRDGSNESPLRTDQTIIRGGVVSVPLPSASDEQTQRFLAPKDMDCTSRNRGWTVTIFPPQNDVGFVEWRMDCWK